jgi:hypothetical protein
MGQFKILYQLLATLSKAKVAEEVYEAALSALLDATGAVRAAILRFDDDGVMRFKAWRGLSAEYRNAVSGRSPWARGEMAAADHGGRRVSGSEPGRFSRRFRKRRQSLTGIRALDPRPGSPGEIHAVLLGVPCFRRERDRGCAGDRGSYCIGRATK